MPLDFLKKCYEPHSLLRLASDSTVGPIYNELLLAIQPLTALPFRLYSTFELNQVSRKQVQDVSQTGVAETTKGRESYVCCIDDVIFS